MLAAIMLAMTATAQAAAISKSLPQPLPSFEPLTNRSALAHNYALVCVYDRDATNFCQKYYGYGCDSSGTKRTSLYHEQCDLLCQCIDLAPKPACMVGLTGTSWCLRSVNQDSTVQDQYQEVLTAVEPSPTSPFAIKTDLVLSELLPDPFQSPSTMPDEISSTVQAINSDQPNEAQNTLQSEDLSSHVFHQWAMLCAGNYATTTVCSRTGYHCHPNGSVGTFNHLDQYCIDVCICVDRLSKTSCSSDESGTIKCDDGGIQEEVVVRHVIEAFPNHHDLMPHADNAVRQIPPNFAMVCASDKQETMSCQQDGYYCDKNGKLQVPAVPNKYCTDNCVCVDVGNKMYCMMANSGAMYCLRSEIDLETHRLDQPQDTSLTVDTLSGSSGEITKRSERYESASRANLEQKDLDASLHNENAEWGSHNMAMVCLNDRFFTNFCQDYGYYCTSSGYLVRKGDGMENPTCEGNCRCIDLYPKPNCIMNLIGGAQCARDVEDPEYGNKRMVGKSERQGEGSIRTNDDENLRPSPEVGKFSSFIDGVGMRSTMVTSIRPPPSGPTP